MIKLNDILKLEDLDKVKIRFNLMVDNNWNPIDIFKNRQEKILLAGQYHNYEKRKSFKEGQITLGFIRIKNNNNSWLLFHVGRVTKDLNLQNTIGYEYEVLSEYDKYLGRLIIEFKNTTQNMIRNARSVIDECYVSQILPDIFDNDIFPGYDNVNISWEELSRVVQKESWKTALQNQKGVYLITDISKGKMYVGSAYGEKMLLQRWTEYVKNVHGGNQELKNIDVESMKKNFRYSILEIYKCSTDNKIILQRESWWKELLLTRKFGYNAN